MRLTKEQLLGCMPGITVENLNKYYEPLADAMEKMSINTPVRMAYFLPQLAHESGCLVYNQELADGSAYEGRVDLGNVHPGDGKKYKGRGPIQCTGYLLYLALSKYFGQDFVNHPELLEGPVWGCLASCYFWTVFKNMNPVADAPETQTFWGKRIGTVDKITWISYRTNGGLNGIDQRRHFFTLSKQIFGL